MMSTLYNKKKQSIIFLIIIFILNFKYINNIFLMEECLPCDTKHELLDQVLVLDFGMTKTQLMHLMDVNLESYSLMGRLTLGNLESPLLNEITQYFDFCESKSADSQELLRNSDIAPYIFYKQLVLIEQLELQKTIVTNYEFIKYNILHNFDDYINIVDKTAYEFYFLDLKNKINDESMVSILKNRPSLIAILHGMFSTDNFIQIPFFLDKIAMNPEVFDKNYQIYINVLHDAKIITDFDYQYLLNTKTDILKYAYSNHDNVERFIEGFLGYLKAAGIHFDNINEVPVQELNNLVLEFKTRFLMDMEHSLNKEELERALINKQNLVSKYRPHYEPSIMYTIFEQRPIENYLNVEVAEKHILHKLNYIKTNDISYLGFSINEPVYTDIVSNYYNDFYAIFVLICVSFIISCILYTISNIFASHLSDTEKLSPYECGFDPFDDARHTFEVKFYLIAILFIIFDLEVAFLFPWAIFVYNYSYSSTIFGMFIFLFLLLIGFIYEWVKGALEWE